MIIIITQPCTHRFPHANALYINVELRTEKSLVKQSNEGCTLVCPVDTLTRSDFAQIVQTVDTDTVHFTKEEVEVASSTEKNS